MVAAVGVELVLADHGVAEERVLPTLSLSLSLLGVRPEKVLFQLYSCNLVSAPGTNQFGPSASEI